MMTLFPSLAAPGSGCQLSVSLVQANITSQTGSQYYALHQALFMLVMFVPYCIPRIVHKTGYVSGGYTIFLAQNALFRARSRATGKAQ